MFGFLRCLKWLVDAELKMFKIRGQMRRGSWLKLKKMNGGAEVVATVKSCLITVKTVLHIGLLYASEERFIKSAIEKILT